MPSTSEPYLQRAGVKRLIIEFFRILIWPRAYLLAAKAQKVIEGFKLSHLQLRHSLTKNH